MGYYVQITDAEFVIPETPEVLQKLKDLNHDPTVEKYGGRSANGQWVERWFSWMPADYDQRVHSVKDVFDLLGFDTESDGESVRLLYYDGKTGQEELFLQAVAPFVKPNSYINWKGEDGYFWKNLVDPFGTLHHLKGKVIYDDPSPE